MFRLCKLAICFFCIFNISCVLAKTETDNLSITSQAAVVIEVSSGRVLYGKNIETQRKIASTTKLMTAMVVMDNCKLSDTAVISKKAAGVGGSEAGIKAGEKITIESLLYGLLLESGNDCAVALAEYVSGSTEEFAKLMNKKAKELGAKNTNYTNPHGLDTEENFCTAYDLALIAREVLKYPKLVEIMATRQIEVKFGNRMKYLANTNRLLSTYTYCIGGKTGFTNGANRCIVTYGQKDDMQIVTVVLGSETTDIRFNECKKLMQYALDTYTLVDISEHMNWYIDIPVYKGSIKNYIRYIAGNLVLPLKEGEVEEIYVKQTLLPVIHTPAKKGNVLGDIAMYIQDEMIYNTEIVLDMDLPKNNVWYYMKYAISHIFDVNLQLF